MAIKQNLMERLLELAQNGQAGLAADIDGTLSAIAASPPAAVIATAVRQALLRLHNSGRYGVIALVSGRSAAAARQMTGLPELVYIGNHGIEVLDPGETTARPNPAAAAFKPLIAAT